LKFAFNLESTLMNLTRKYWASFELAVSQRLTLAYFKMPMRLHSLFPVTPAAGGTLDGQVLEGVPVVTGMKSFNSGILRHVL